jgi:probable HAF family extracellular repeat protein
MRRITALLVFSIALGAGASAAPLATFEALGVPYADAHEISADGAVVVGGTGAPGAGPTAFRWTAENGMTPIAEGSALGASTDASVVVGWLHNPGYSEAFRWTAASGAVRLGFLADDVDSVAFDTSADGSVVVGYSIQDQASGWRATAFRWSEGGGMLDLGPAPHGEESLARGVSADGSLIVGELRGTGGSEAFLWTPDVGIIGLGDLPNSTQSLATDVSADGTVVVGTSGGFPGQGVGARAFRWSVERGMQELPFAVAHSVSADGSVIVGEAADGSAIVWTASGARSLASLLRAYGVDLSDWRLDRATGVSDDGLVIVGWGSSPRNGIQSWRVTLAVAECENGLDDDGDGVADFPADSGCSDPTDLSERGTIACDNALDDDDDGVADFPVDPGCDGPGDLSESGVGTCDNDLDDDGDGRIDVPEDPGCAGVGDESELSAIRCDNGIDDDRDGKIDWRGDGTGDPECTSLTDGFEHVTPPVPPPGGCGVGPELVLLLPAIGWLRRRAVPRSDRAERR